MDDLRTLENIRCGKASASRVRLSDETRKILQKRYIAFDTETTGFDPDADRIVEIGAVLFLDGMPSKEFHSNVRAERSIPEEVSRINHVSEEIRRNAPSEQEVYQDFLAFLGDAADGKTIMCGHVAAFDMSLLCHALERILPDKTASFKFVDTRELILPIPELEHHTLIAAAEYFGVQYDKAHHALVDALACGEILRQILKTSV